MIRDLKAARLAADISDVPLIILARTDANAAKLITNDFDENYITNIELSIVEFKLLH